jgi:uncharacterized membrane protein YfhO
MRGINVLSNNRKRILGFIYCYLFLILAAASMHAYFIYYGLYFNEVCCDSFMQISHFYPFLQHEYSQGNLFWSWSYGLGGDIFSEFLYYLSTSPFFWLTMLFDISSIKEIFEIRLFISIFKLSLAMIFMYHLLRYWKRTNLSSLTSSLIFGGSLYYLFYSYRYDFMVDGMVWLPLLIYSYERLVDQNKKGLFVFMIFLTVSSNFYLAFINTSYLFLYAVVKYFLSRNTYNFIDFLKYYGKTIGLYCIGVLLSAFALLPAIYAFTHVDRFFYELSIPLLY